MKQPGHLGSRKHKTKNNSLNVFERIWKPQKMPEMKFIDYKQKVFGIMF